MTATIGGALAMKPVERKVTKIGNSLGITVPQDIFNLLGVNLGDIVSLEVNNENDEIIIKKQKKVSLPKDVDPMFLDIVSDVFERYDETLKGLANR
ncbi:AbrB family transcriptional regulator [Bacillus thuringiensis]|uniref:AbrB family transcriptional regulator n=2 Tax=Bacillus thuringiensis TaxID=1428 RepID=A0A9X6U514_BACTU|nr:AbrB family transcriptional regulator [Bacillus thuringiensis]PES54546.1 AbrB family transcriptional regulator [Bacillus thuringiensis]PGO85266.1 AbrB family transcriptional regulator [Bacillus thuringiensis]